LVIVCTPVAPHQQLRRSYTRKQQIIHCVNGDGSKTQQNQKKRRNYPPSHHLSINVMLNNIIFFTIFAAFDPSPVVLCIYICCFITNFTIVLFYIFLKFRRLNGDY